VKIGIDDSKKRGVDKSGIGIEIIGIVRSLFITGNGVSNCRPFRIVPSAMVTVGTIDQIKGSGPIIDVLMGRSEEGHQFKIGWGVGLTCMND
jgi:hypothetical protein